MSIAEELTADLSAQLDVVEQQVNLLLENDAPDATTEDLVTLWERLDALRSRLVGTMASILPTVRGRDPRHGQIIPSQSGTPVKVNYGKDRKAWDHDRIAAVVAEVIVEEAMDDGVITVPPSQLVLRMLEFVGIRDWKVTPLKARGIDPAKFCEETPGNMNLQAMR